MSIMPTLSGSHHKTSVAVAESSLGSDLAVTEVVGGGEAYPFAAGLAMGKTWSVRRDR